MCVVSFVHDHFDKNIPWAEPVYPGPKIGPFVPGTTGTSTVPEALEKLFQPIISLKDFRDLVDEFRRLIEAAKEIDRITGQPDCLDPEKAKLEDRVKQLEAIIASPPEFVILSGGKIEPGKYRVIEGKLYKLVD